MSRQDRQMGRAARRTRLLVCAASVMTLAIASDVLAAATDTASDSTALGELVVTARGRVENNQKVPLAITSISGAQIKAASATSLQDITFLTPGLTYNSNGAQANASPVIRGLSDTSGGEATSQNVSVFLDGIYIANPSAIDLALGGLERIEVVKGPVSGLYGRNAFTGAINYVTAKPTQTFHADADFTLGDDGRRIVSGDVSGPLIPDILSARIAASYDNLDGTYKDPVSGLKANGHEKEDVLVTLKYTPNSHITITPVFYYGHDDFGPAAAVTYKPNCAIGTSNSYCGSLNQNELGPFIATANGANETGLTRRVIHAHLDAKFAYDWGTVDVLAGLNDITTESIADFDGTENGIPYAIYPAGANNPFAGDPPLAKSPVLLKNFFGDQATERDKSVEFRYDSPQPYKLRVAAGGYFYYHIATNNNTFGIDGAPIPAGDVINFIAQNYVSSNGQSLAPLNFARSTTRDVSGFGSAEYDILPTLTASVSLRETSEQQQQQQPGGPLLSKTFNSLTSNSSLTWRPTSLITAYLAVANGEKSGGFNGSSTGPADATFAPETDWNYEAGVKTTLFDGHLRLNADVFHITLYGLQVLGPPSTAGAIGLVVKNFGSVHANGGEVEGDYVYDGFNLGGGVGYSDPRFRNGSDDFNDGAACAAIPSCANTRLVTVAGQKAINLQGLAPPFSSDWTFNVTAGYHHPIGVWNGVDWFVRGDYRLESKQYNTVANFAYWGSRNIGNIHAGLEAARWTVTGWVLNLGNDRTPVTNQFNGTLNGFDAPPYGVFGVNWIPTSVLPDGRTYGVTVAFRY